jgi:asparagine synthase (glutamine-hydrolysing)
MSGIAGLHRIDGQPPDRRGIERMLSAFVHRGPDGAAIWTGSAAALGHAALWTTPEARHERLPAPSQGADLGITADARLDNRRELAALLGLTAGAGVARGDGELILRAYQQWGPACVSRLEGDFAFAIWDGRQQRLVCARDRVGVKPFYYAETAGAFLFASEVKALLTSPMVPYRLDPVRVADHLVGLFDDPAITFYRDIRRLPAGHMLVVDRGSVRRERYWSLDGTRATTLGSDDAYAEAFRHCFLEAVRCRLRGDGIVGCFLSGGLDTSSIVASARHIRQEQGEGPLHTLTAVFPGLPMADLRKIDERAFVDAVVGQGGLDPHIVRGDLLNPLGNVERAVWHLEEPFAAPNLYLHWALYDAASQRGLRVVLDGVDGDTTVSHGFESLTALARSGKVGTLARELRALSRRYRVGAGSLLWQFGIAPLMPAVLYRLARWRRRRSSQGWMTDAAIRPDFARRVGIVERVETSEARQRPARSARAAHLRAMTSPLIPYALELADRAAAAFGVEPRYPFFDRRLMELCLSFPADQKLRGGWTRLVMRRAMKGLLPEDVRWRSSKANLAPNFTRQLLERNRSVLGEVLGEQSGLIEDYVDVPTVRRAYDRYVANPESERDALTVYRAVVLALWLQRAKISP